MGTGAWAGRQAETSPRRGGAAALIPQPSSPLAWDRYALALNNPLRYTDPSGHFPDETILATLDAEYGEAMADLLFYLWQKNDPFYMWALRTAEDGTQFITTYGGSGFFKIEKGLIEIRGEFPKEPGVIERKKTPLHELQGKGEYNLRHVDGSRPAFHYDDIAVPQYTYTYHLRSGTISCTGIYALVKMNAWFGGGEIGYDWEYIEHIYPQTGWGRAEDINFNEIPGFDFLKFSEWISFIYSLSVKDFYLYKNNNHQNLASANKALNMIFSSK